MITAVLVLARTLHIGSAMMLVALSYFMMGVLNLAGEAESHAPFLRRMTRCWWGSLMVEALSGAVWFWVVAAQMIGQSPWTFLELSDLNVVFRQTQFGQLWLGRLAIGAALGVTLCLFSQKRSASFSRTSVSAWLVLFLSGFLLITLAWAGHAAAGIHHRAFHLGIDVLHLMIGSVWPTGLIPLGLFLGHTHSRDGVFPGKLSVDVLLRFSRASFVAVLLLAITGLINGWLMIGTWRALVTTNYGQLLVVKVLAVIIMVGLGAGNRFYLLPRIKEGTSVFRSLRNMILIESCLAVVVLVIVGMMGMTAPPAR